jgi:hypothetical protein
LQHPLQKQKEFGAHGSIRDESTMHSSESKLSLACESELNSALAHASESPQLQHSTEAIFPHLISSKACMTESSVLSKYEVCLSAAISPSVAEEITTSCPVQTQGGWMCSEPLSPRFSRPESLSPRFSCISSPAQEKDDEDGSVQASIVFKEDPSKRHI